MKNLFQQLDIKKAAILALIVGLIISILSLSIAYAQTPVRQQLVETDRGTPSPTDWPYLYFTPAETFAFNALTIKAQWSASGRKYMGIRQFENGGWGIKACGYSDVLPEDVNIKKDFNFIIDIETTQNICGLTITEPIMTFLAGNNYQISYGRPNYIWGSASDVFSEGYIANTSGLADAYFILWGEAAANIEFIEPVNNAILENDFNYWRTNVRIPEAGNYRVSIFYGRPDDPHIYSDRTDFYWPEGTTIEINTLKRWPLGIGEWQANAKLRKCYEADCSTGWDELAEQTINFSISGILPPGEPESGEPLDLSVCYDEQYSWIERALCIVNIKVFRALFIPTPESVNRFNLIWPAIEKKPPVGYFTAIKGGLDTLTEQSPAFNFNLPEELKNMLFNPIRTGTAAVLWLFFGVWGIKRLSRLEL